MQLLRYDSGQRSAFRARITFGAAILLSALLMPARAIAQQCLHYEPDTVRIAGVLEQLTFPGPPNYQSISNGDRPQTGYYLRLPNSICTIESPDYEAKTGVKLVQLVLDSLGFATLRPQVGKSVTLVGTLFPAQRPSHHAPILLTVDEPDSFK